MSSENENYRLSKKAEESLRTPMFWHRVANPSPKDIMFLQARDNVTKALNLIETKRKRTYLGRKSLRELETVLDERRKKVVAFFAAPGITTEDQNYYLYTLGALEAVTEV